MSGEPTVTDAREATSLAITKGCDGVVSVGGGSAIDLGKVRTKATRPPRKAVQSKILASNTSKILVFDLLQIVFE